MSVEIEFTAEQQVLDALKRYVKEEVKKEAERQFTRLVRELTKANLERARAGRIRD